MDMKKNILNEEVSRIKNMMKKLNESEFEAETTHDMPMAEENDDYDDDEDKKEMELGYIGVWLRNWVVDVDLPSMDDSIEVEIEASNYQIDKIKVPNKTQNNNKVTPEMKHKVIEFIKQKMSDNSLMLPPVISLDFTDKTFGT